VKAPTAAADRHRVCIADNAKYICVRILVGQRLDLVPGYQWRDLPLCGSADTNLPRTPAILKNAGNQGVADSSKFIDRFKPAIAESTYKGRSHGFHGVLTMRYFFDYTAKDQSLLDYKGDEFTNSQSAIDFAESMAQLLTHSLGTDWAGWSIEVRNAAGEKLLSLQVGGERQVDFGMDSSGQAFAPHAAH
jgi:hypothetical protein